MTVKASVQGLAIVDRARLRKGWTKTRTPIWWELAHTSQATLRRFWRGKAIQTETFASICQAVGISDWQTIIDQSPEIEADAAVSESTSESTLEIRSDLRQDWQKLPDVNYFYGRTKELNQLEQWISTDRCKLVVLLGMGGIGKTTLAVALADAIQDDFEGLVWRSLHPAPPLPVLLSDLVSSLSQQPVTFSPTEVRQGIARLIECLRQLRCLIILDEMEAILRSSEGRAHPRVGSYQEGYEDYSELLQRISKQRHQSCVLVTSREKPQEIAALEGQALPVRCLQLRGLQEPDACELFKAKGFLGTEPKLAELVRLYRGNPLALKVITTIIQEVFNGSIIAFLSQNTIVVPHDLRALIGQQVNRLSNLEKEVVYWLTIAIEPITLVQLRSYLLTPPTQSVLLEAIASLERRSLLEKLTGAKDIQFALQPLVSKVLTDELIDQVLGELFSIIATQTLAPLNLLRSHALVKPSSDTTQPSAHWLTNRLKDRLYAEFKNEYRMERELKAMLPLLKHQSLLAIGYTSQNLMELFRILDIGTIDDWQDIPLWNHRSPCY
jgi:hypothetical protein